MLAAQHLTRAPALSGTFWGLSKPPAVPESPLLAAHCSRAYALPLANPQPLAGHSGVPKSSLVWRQMLLLLHKWLHRPRLHPQPSGSRPSRCAFSPGRAPPRSGAVGGLAPHYCSRPLCGVLHRSVRSWYERLDWHAAGCQAVMALMSWHHSAVVRSDDLAVQLAGGLLHVADLKQHRPGGPKQWRLSPDQALLFQLLLTAPPKLALLPDQRAHAELS